MSDTDGTTQQDTDAPDMDATSTDTGSDAGGQETDHAAEAAKWKAMARKHEAQAKANAEAARKLAEVEDAKKTETERATEKATEAEQRAAAAESRALQIEVAMDKAPDGMSLAQVRKLAKRLTGATREELEADADELFADFAPPAGDGDQDGARRRPTERLRPGATPGTEPDETDPDKLAAKVPRMY